jgi:H+/gluconate symporter-like permease
MNPSTPVALASGGVMHDVRPPTPKVPPPTTPIKAEVVESIPVRNPDAVAQPAAQMAATNPIAAGWQSSLESARPAVNPHLKTSETKEQRQTNRQLSVARLLPVVAALLVASGLVAAAILSFRQSGL